MEVDLLNIDNNETQKQAMRAFAAHDREKGDELQDGFLAEVRAFREGGGDHCTCKKNCKHHGNCLECVAIHRGHRDHLPNCFHDMVNERLVAVSGLTEHSVKEEI